MTTGFEAYAGRAASKALSWMVSEAKRARIRVEITDVLPSISTALADSAFDELPPGEIGGAAAYLGSPDFEHVVLQVLAAQVHKSRDEIDSAIREQVREGLRHRGVTDSGRLLVVTDVVLAAAGAACARLVIDVEADGAAAFFSGKAHLAAMAARNGRLLARLGELASVHEQARRLRTQVAALHRELRLPHTGVSRTVPWDELYVQPELQRERDFDMSPPGIAELTLPGSTTVVLGDPGAGKSTLAAKLAHDLATSVEADRVPFLLVLREHAEAMRSGDRALTDYLGAVAKAPYNVDLLPDAIEYLLLNGRAAVILDGLDELTDVALRGRVADLIMTFTNLYPLVPILATSRRIGYRHAPIYGFRVCLIAPFDQGRVEAYVRNWFALNDSLQPAERDRLREAFLRESEPIEDLRRNPLLLSLLCSMYATEQYIPRNRAQVYERCAILVFDRWDSMRGIRVPVEFEGKVRGAMQELAWHMLTHRVGTELPRSKILSIIAEYLRARHFDEDDARALAVEFLTFCAGRAWVLAEVGATETEPIYGFAHRTFLEYFAAEHLVRHHPTPDQAWRALQPRLDDNRWDVLAMLAVQLLDRNVDEGAEAIVGLALTGSRMDPNFISFAARTCGQVGLSPNVISRIVDAAVDLVLSWQIKLRVRYWHDDLMFKHMAIVDDPLYTLMYRCLRGNLPYIRRALGARLGLLASVRDATGLMLLNALDRHNIQESSAAAPWIELKAELSEAHSIEMGRWRESQPWSQILDSFTPETVDEVFDRHGAQPFYLSDAVLTLASYPPACSMLATSEPGMYGPASPDAALRLRTRLLAGPMPWLPTDSWFAGDPDRRESACWSIRQVLDRAWPTSGDDLATFIILFLPYLETPIRFGFVTIPALLYPRWDENATLDAEWEKELAAANLPPECALFVRKWVAHEINVIG